MEVVVRTNNWSDGKREQLSDVERWLELAFKYPKDCPALQNGGSSYRRSVVDWSWRPLTGQSLSFAPPLFWSMTVKLRPAHSRGIYERTWFPLTAYRQLKGWNHSRESSFFLFIFLCCVYMLSVGSLHGIMRFVEKKKKKKIFTTCAAAVTSYWSLRFFWLLLYFFPIVWNWERHFHIIYITDIYIYM